MERDVPGCQVHVVEKLKRWWMRGECDREMF